LIGLDGIGIYVQQAENSLIKFNHIEDATDYGLKAASETEFIEITRNEFINNGVSVQVYDEGINNTFIYNYYDDWVSPDADSDQIVDVPYAIDGNAPDEDPYPLAVPDAIPPESVVTTTTNTINNTGVQIPLEIMMLAGGAVVIVMVAIFFVKRNA